MLENAANEEDVLKKLNDDDSASSSYDGYSSSDWGIDEYAAIMAKRDGPISPMDVLKYELIGPERMSKLEKKLSQLNQPFEAPHSHEIAGYTLANLAKIQACTNRHTLNLSIEDMGARNKFGVSLLHKACRYPSWPAACTIASCRKELCTLRDDLGRLPLHDACWNQHVSFDAINFLISQYPLALLAADHRGHLPLSYVPRHLWPQWCCFLRGLDNLVADMEAAFDEKKLPPQILHSVSNHDQSSGEENQNFAGKRLREETNDDDLEDVDDDSSSSSSEDSENTDRNWALAGQIAATLFHSRQLAKRAKQEEHFEPEFIQPEKNNNFVPAQPQAPSSWLALSAFWPSCKGSAFATAFDKQTTATFDDTMENKLNPKCEVVESN